MGIKTFDCPYRYIAADVNGSGSVSAADIVVLRKLILGLIATLPNSVPSWRFVASDYNFSTPNPAGEAFAETREIPQNVQSNAPNQDFFAIKIGDVSKVNFQEPATAVDRSPQLLSVADRFFEKGERIRAIFELENARAAGGFQTTLEAAGDGLQIVSVEPAEGFSSEDFAVFEDQNLATFAWAAASEPAARAAFSIDFLAKKAGKLSDFVSISSKITPSEAFGSDLEQRDLSLFFDQKKAGSGATIAAWPNPFLDRTFLAFEMPEAGEAVLKISDSAGRLVFSRAAFFEKGAQKMAVAAADLGAATGFLSVQILTKTGAAAGKMWRVR